MVFRVAWCCLVFGFPGTILSDNGGEFENEQMRSFAANFDVTVKTTAAESPFSNGITERHNAILTESFEKLKADDRNSDR